MTNVIADLDLLHEIVLGEARGGRRVAAPLAIAKIRSLCEADLEAIQNPPPVQAPQRLVQIRHSHHQLARLIASGKSDQETSLLTGYSPAWICSLKGGKDFQDLIKYYSDQKDLIFVEVMERMKVIGLSSIDEIQRRFEESPESFTNNQLMELTELMIIKPIKAQSEGFGPKQGGAGGGPSVQVNVQFVQGAPSDQIEQQDGDLVVESAPRLAGARLR